MDRFLSSTARLDHRPWSFEPFATLVTTLTACIFAALWGCDTDLESPSQESSPTAESTAAEPPDSDVVAVVNDREIHQIEVEQRLDQIGELYRHSRRPFDDDMREAKRKKVVQGLVDRELLRDHIKSRDLQIDSELVDQALERRIESKFGSSASFRRYLDAQDMTVSDFRNQIREELAIGELLSDDDNTIDEQQLRKHYERIANRRPAGQRVLVSTISLRLEDQYDEATEDRLQNIVEDILASVDPDTGLAGLRDELSAHVDVQLSHPQWLERDHLDGRTARMLFEQTTPSGPSPLIDTPTGFDFYWVHEQREAGMRDFDEVRDLLRERAQRGYREKQRRRLVEQLRDDASITINLPDVSSPFVEHDD